MADVFFIASKLAWGILSPSNLMIIALLIATLCLLKGAVTAAKYILFPTVFLAASLMIYPWGEWVIYPLESRFEQPSELPDEIDGIIVLGGGEQLKTSISWQSPQLGAGGDRYIAAAKLAKHYPEAPVIFTGGHNFLRFDAKGREGDIAHQVLTTIGIDETRLRIESASRNTNENMQLVQVFLPQRSGQYLLVTSAFHMPRAMGVARQQSLNVIAYPVDYRSNRPELRRWSMHFYDHLDVLEPAWREWIGLTAYYLTGKTQHWFPHPISKEQGKNTSHSSDSDKLYN